MTLKIFPWDNDIEPYFVNDKGLEWYVNDSMSRWCYRPTANDLPELKAVCFYVAERDKEKVTPISMVLLDIETNEILYDSERLEDMATYIDMLRYINSEP